MMKENTSERRASVMFPTRRWGKPTSLSGLYRPPLPLMHFISRSSICLPMFRVKADYPGYPTIPKATIDRTQKETNTSLRVIPTMTFYLIIFLAFWLAYLLTVFLAYLLAFYLVCLLALYLAYLLALPFWKNFTIAWVSMKRMFFFGGDWSESMDLTARSGDL